MVLASSGESALLLDCHWWPTVETVGTDARASGGNEARASGSCWSTWPVPVTVGTGTRPKTFEGASGRPVAVGASGDHDQDGDPVGADPGPRSQSARSIRAGPGSAPCCHGARGAAARRLRCKPDNALSARHGAPPVAPVFRGLRPVPEPGYQSGTPARSSGGAPGRCHLHRPNAAGSVRHDLRRRA